MSGRPPWPAGLVLAAAAAPAALVAALLPASVVDAGRRVWTGNGGVGATKAGRPAPPPRSPPRRGGGRPASRAPRGRHARAPAGATTVTHGIPLAFDVALAGGKRLRVDLPHDTLLSELAPALASAAGCDPSHMRLLVVEDRARAGAPSLARSARAAARRLAAPAAGPRDALVSVLHFLLLPEAIAREVRGRGVTGWLRNSAAWRAVAGPAAAAAAAPPPPPPPPDSVPLRVELLNGDAFTVHARGDATLAAARVSLEAGVGVLAEAQRWLAVQAPPPGLVTRAAAAAAVAGLGLASAAARRAAGAAAALAGVSSDDRRVAVVVRAGTGAPVELDLPPEATLAQVRAAVDAACGRVSGGGKNPASPARSVALVFPGTPRRARAEGDILSVERA